MDRTRWQNIKDHLAALLELPDSRRAAYLAGIGDGAVRAEVEQLFAAHLNATDFIAEPFLHATAVETDAVNTTFVGQRIDNYLIRERIGMGGMGVVYRAERLNSDFKQPVALKIIKRGMDSEAILRRFAFERRILSTLKHANIAQLIDGGISADGLSYFVMEFVEGKPLIQYCDEHELSFEQRLEIFRQICSAVEYAHRNLIIHRDLKPTNVLVTTDGVPKLLDFGIAKLLTNDDEAVTLTITSGRVFTPEYASPEQMLGKPVTTATDVYSLGVILYELLSGYRPYEIRGKSLDEIVRAISETEPAKPSEASTNYKSAKTRTADEDAKVRTRALQTLRGDLDNIVLKALRKDPAERYGSVEKLSEDILRYLQGLPVLARPQTLRYRFSKYFKRHKAGVVGALIVLLSLVGGISVATWQAVEARRQRANAELRFAEVRQLANSVVFELHDAIENLPGSTPARELLIRRGLDYLDRLSGESQGDLRLQSELADAYERIGDIQGGLNAANLGQTEKSFESYQKALSIREAVVAADPANVEFRSRLSTSYSKFAGSLWIKTDLAGSLAYSEKAFLLNRELLNENPANTELRFKLAASQTEYGHKLAANGRIAEALPYNRESVATMESMVAAEPENRTFRQGLMVAYDKLADILGSTTENYRETLELTLKSQDITLTMLGGDPQSPNLRRSAAVGYFNIALAYTRLNDFKIALENIEKATEIAEKLLQEDPKNEDLRQILAAFETEFGAILIKIDKAAEAVERLRHALTVLEYLKTKSPGDEIVNFRIGRVQARLGQGYAMLAQAAPRANSLKYWQLARQFYQQAAAIYKKYDDSGKLVGDEAAESQDVRAELSRVDERIAGMK